MNYKQIESLVSYVAFDNMKNVNSLDFFKNTTELSFAEKDASFFGKGKVGTWREFFTPELSEKFDEFIKNNLKTQIDFDYGD